MEILKKRVGNDLTIKLTLTDSGVRVSWKGVEVITAQMYSDAQRVVAGFCDVAVDPTDEEVLLVKYGANEPQYLGFNRLILSCVYDGNTATYDRTVVKYVAITEEEGTETVDDVDVELTVPSSTESIEITAESISSTILEQIIEDAREATTDANAAATRANTAAGRAEGLVDSIEEELRKKYEKPSTGIPESDLSQSVQEKLNNRGDEAKWGNISGNLTDQTDLSTALGKKYEKPSAGVPESDLSQAVKDKLNDRGGGEVIEIPYLTNSSPMEEIKAVANTLAANPNGKFVVIEGALRREVIGIEDQTNPETGLTAFVLSVSGDARTWLEQINIAGVEAQNAWFVMNTSLKEQIPSVSGLQSTSDRQNTLTSSTSKYPSSKGVIDYIAGQSFAKSTDLANKADKVAVNTLTTDNPVWALLPYQYNVCETPLTSDANIVISPYCQRGEETTIRFSVAEGATPTLTWVVDSWLGGEPTIEGGKTYIVSVLDGLGVIGEF